MKYQLRKRSEMKDSGVDWIGNTPASWLVEKQSRLVNKRFGGTWGESEADENTGVLCVRVADFLYQQLVVRKSKNTYRVINERELKTKKLKFGDLLLEKSGGGEKTPVGRMIRYDLEKNAVNSNFIETLRLSDEVDSRYICYMNKTMYDMRVNKKHIKQTTGIQNLDVKSYLSERILVPKLSEQKKIADFLDQQTQLIDKIVAKKKKQIELLKEQRSALINQSVTKGLDPNVIMKDSGIEWIGKIPEGWQVKKLKHVASIQASNVDKKSVEGEENVKLCNYTDVYNNEYITSQINFLEATASSGQIKKLSLKKGSVLATKDSESADDIFVPTFVSGDLPHVVCGYHLYYISVNHEEMVGEFLFRYLQSNFVRKYSEIYSNGVTRFGLSQSPASSTPVLLPPIEEQEVIIDYLKKETDRIDKIIDSDEKSIVLIKEYLSSLIASAVTGKIRVL